MDLLIEIAAVAIVYTLLAILIQRKIGNPRKVSELQAKMNGKLKEYKEKSKAGSVVKEEIDAIQKELGAISSELMRHQMKPMIVSLAFVALVLYVLLPALIAQQPQTVSLFSMTLSDRTAFILIALVVGMPISIYLLINDRKRLKATQSTAQVQTNT